TPLIVLAFFSVFAGFIELPHNFGHFTLFSDLVQKTLPAVVQRSQAEMEWLFQLVASLVTLLGIYVGYVLYYRSSPVMSRWKQSVFMNQLREFFLSGWRFDHLYNTLFLKPFSFIAEINKG